MRSLTKRQKDMALLVLSIIFFIILISYSWFQLFTPAKEENTRVVDSLVNQREIQFELQRQLAAKTEDVSSSSRPLQKKVPVLPLEELLIVQLERAEVKSDTLIQDVLFTKEDLVLNEEASSVEEETITDNPSASLNQLLIDVDLTASSYEQLDRFIREMEQTERIFIVQSIDFDPPEEQVEADAEVEPLELTISFQAFYRPDLTELQSEVPKLDAPMPAGKDNPTTRAGDDE